jgi:hypothetical protein
MSNSEKIRSEIEKQISAGFTRDEIKQNLLAQQFEGAEIDACLKQYKSVADAQPAKNSTGTSVVSLLVSIYFIINGSMKVSSNPSGLLHTWGIIMICVGLAGAVWKTIDLVRR